jgi:RHS repeat-associated protein
MGPSLLLKVMSGDKIDLGVQEYYNSGTTSTPGSSLTDVLASLATGIVNASGGAKGSVADLNNTSTSPVYAALNSFLTGNDPDPSGKPKAYLNWILLDEQLKYVSSYPQSGAIVVGAAGTLNNLSYTGIPITKSGYLYIWVSNETPNWDVFFDNLAVKHYSGPLLEETHYYPFGLTMAGISSKALKPYYAENRYKFNGGNELQSKEFSDGSGLEWYDAAHRMYDPQTGRFGQIDPLSDIGLGFSPFSFASNNPISRSDPFGLKDTVINGETVQRDKDLATVTFTGKHTTQNLINTYWYLVNRGVDLYRVKDRGLRDWLVNYDNTQQWLSNLHLKQREDQEEWLEYASWIIPIPLGEIRIAGKLGDIALKLMRSKVGLEVGTHLVYQGVDAAGVVRYVGITGRELAEREAEHLAATGTGKEFLRYEAVEGASGLTKQEARVIEQKLINQYGLQKDGGQLLNKINSIAEKYWQVNGVTK